MIARLLHYFKGSPSGLLTSRLYDEQTFYRALVRDLSNCRREAIIECPFITSKRVASLLPIFTKMRSRGVSVVINTRHSSEHDVYFDTQADAAISQLQDIGMQVLFTGGHHRKLAIFDRKILWEGNLNILSQNDSCEIMRRIESEELTRQMIGFAKLNRFLNRTC